MDMLYSRYSNPLEFMGIYINSGRFGEWVSEILDLDYQRKKEEAKKEDDAKMWDLYIHSMSDKSFIEWKREVLGDSVQGNAQNGAASDFSVEKTIENSRAILRGLNMKE